MFKPYVVSLVFALMGWNKGNFLLPADYLIQQSGGGTLGLPCGVGVNVHRGTDVGVSEKLLHILWRCSVGKQIACKWKGRASETGSDSCRSRADSSHAERNPLRWLVFPACISGSTEDSLSIRYLPVFYCVFFCRRWGKLSSLILLSYSLFPIFESLILSD